MKLYYKYANMPIEEIWKAAREQYCAAQKKASRKPSPKLMSLSPPRTSASKISSGRPAEHISKAHTVLRLL